MMDTMDNIDQDIQALDIDPALWREAYGGKGDFVDFTLAIVVAEAVGLRPKTETDEEIGEALAVAQGRWPLAVSA